MTQAGVLRHPQQRSLARVQPCGLLLCASSPQGKNWTDQSAQITLLTRGRRGAQRASPKTNTPTQSRRRRSGGAMIPRPSAAAGLVGRNAAALAGPHGRAARARGHGLRGHALLDGGGHGHEGLLHVGGVLGARLQEGDADLVSKRLGGGRLQGGGWGTFRVYASCRGGRVCVCSCPW